MKALWLKIKAQKKTLLILAGILLVGIFLRTYNFREWLYFGEDQANDALITGSAAEGKMVWPLLGAEMGNTNFRLGAMYYYFQVISAKIFGNQPEVMAYPDLLFSLLFLGLFYFFLRKYFSTRIALPLVGLMAVSFFAVRYARFAWNPNPIPFFSLLFLLTALEWLKARENVKWIWIVFLGMVLGVCAQLHMIFFMTLAAFTFCLFIFFIKAFPKMWKQWAVVLLVVLFLNAGQIIYEIRTNGSNVKNFWSVFSDRSQSGSSRMIKNISADVDCHLQANLHILSALEDKDNCNFQLLKLATDWTGNLKKITRDGISPLVFLFFSLAFSATAYALGIYYYRKEKAREKKIFLLVVGLYLGLYFLVMSMSIREAPLRYFIPMLFAPFLFLGLIMKFLTEKFGRIGQLISGLLVLFLILSNGLAIRSVIKELSAKERTSYRYSVLGEMEDMVAYMQANTDGKKEAYLTGNRRYIINLYRPLMYLAQKNGLKLIEDKGDKEIQPNIPIFHLTDDAKKNIRPGERKILGQEKFGKIFIYNLEN
jgi:4-amino-4-deoxy-L-arabinose transferase-like glycosyltransferase